MAEVGSILKLCKIHTNGTEVQINLAAVLANFPKIQANWNEELTNWADVPKDFIKMGQKKS